MAIGSWRLVAVASGWWLAIGGWWGLAVGSWWRLVVGNWWLVGVGGGWWGLVVGGWQLVAVGGWWSLGRSLAKRKKLGSLRTALQLTCFYQSKHEAGHGPMVHKEGDGPASKCKIA